MRFTWVENKRQKSWARNNGHAIQETPAGYIAYWGYIDMGIPAQLSENTFPSLVEAMAFCEGFNFRQQQLMSNPIHCMKCAAPIKQ